MVQGYQPDRPRNFKGNQSGVTVYGTVPIPAAFDLGYHPDSPRIFRGEQPGQPTFPQVSVPGVFSIDEIVATRPDRPRNFIAKRIPLHVGELTTILAPFSMESTFAIRPDRPNLRIANRIPLPVGETASIGTPQVGPEMTFSSRPERQAGSLAPRIGLPTQPPFFAAVPGPPSLSNASTGPDMFTPPVPTLPLIDPVVGWHIKNAFDQIVNRVNALRMFNRDLGGDILVQIPQFGTQPSVMFNTDRAMVRTDGSHSLFGGIGLPIKRVVATTVMQATDFCLMVDAALAPVTIYLPAAITCAGRLYTIKKIDSTVNAVTIDANGSELIDGATTNVLAAQWNGRLLQSDGTAWYILSNI